MDNTEFEFDQELKVKESISNLQDNIDLLESQLFKRDSKTDNGAHLKYSKEYISISWGSALSILLRTSE